MAGSSIYSSKKVVKTGIKVENLKLHIFIMFIVNFSKKRFFHFFAFYIDIKFHVKVINSLARVLQKLVVIRFFYIWLEVRGEQGEL